MWGILIYSQKKLLHPNYSDQIQFFTRSALLISSLSLSWLLQQAEPACIRISSVVPHCRGAPCSGWGLAAVSRAAAPMQSHTSDLVGFLSPFGLHLQTCKGRKTGKHEEVKHKLTQKEESEIGFRRKKKSWQLSKDKRRDGGYPGMVAFIYCCGENTLLCENSASLQRCLQNNKHRLSGIK